MNKLRTLWTMMVVAIVAFCPPVSAQNEKELVANPNFKISDIIKADPAFSPDEVAKMDKGQIVVQDNADGSLGGVASTYILANPEQVWTAATDYDHYIEYMPEIISIEKKATGENATFLSATYKSTWPFDSVFLETLNLYDKSNPEHLLKAWKATKTNMKFASGYWIVKPYKNGSLVTYQMGFDMAWIPRSIARPTSRKRVAAVLEAVKNRVAKKETTMADR